MRNSTDSDSQTDDTYRLGHAQDALAILLQEGWGPDDVEVTDGEVRLIYSVDTGTEQ